jgi:predicted metal-dependent peptidase
MAKTKKKTLSEAEINEAIAQGIEDAVSVTQAEKDEFRRDVDTITYKFSLEFPFWGVISERCSFSLTKVLVPTAGITKTGHIIFNVNFVKSLKEKHGKNFPKKFLFLVAHEIAHFAFEHAERQGERDPFIFNHAADYAINLLLHYQFDGNSDYFIESGLLDEKYKDMSAEEIYELIKDDDKFKQPENGEGGKGDGCGGIGSDIRGDLTEEDVAADGGLVRERRVPLPDMRGKTKEQIRKEIGDWVMKAAQEGFAVAKQQGNMPGNFERAISKLLRPQVDWLTALKQKLRFGCSRTEKRDVTWSYPNRRFVGSDIYLPGNVGPESPKIVYAVDTSGSMSQKDLEQAISELEDIRKRFRARVYFMDCDAQVHGSRWIQPFEALPKLAGGGGTDFVPVFNHLIQNRIRPDYCVFFTDGYGSFPDTKPPFDTLWVMTSDVKPPFGEVVRVNVPFEGN